MSLPTFLYKYRKVDADKIESAQLDKDFSIKALFECEAYLSSRLAFNDLFDSKVKFIHPKPEQILALPQTTAQLQAIPNLLELVSDGQLTQEGNKFIRDFEDSLVVLLDSYPFYCLSKNGKSNLMWSHYADSHKGFCIEFKTEYLKADRVEYQMEIPEIELIDFLNHKTQKDFSKKIWDALRTKLEEWKYEDEYRFQPGNAMPFRKLPKGEKCAPIKYDATWVESIIFGCRMPKVVKKYITTNIPFDVKFKQAIELDSSIDIVDY